MAKREVEGNKGKKRKAEEVEEADTKSSVSEEEMEVDETTSESEYESETHNTKVDHHPRRSSANCRLLKSNLVKIDLESIT
jgi:hypothetical protein